MKTIIFALPLFLAANLGLAYPSDPASKGLPPLTKGLPPLTKGLPPLTKGLPPLTKGLPPPPPTTQTKGLPPPPPTTQTKGLPPQGPNSLLSVLPPEAADLLTTITPDCQAAIFSIVISPEFLKCIPIPSFIPLIPVVTDPSIITNFLADPAKNYPPLEKPLVQFATAFCPAPKCSDKGVAEAVKTLNEGCKADLKNKNKLIQMLVGVATLYSPLHDSICFQNPKKVFCWDETILTAISLPKSPIKIVDGGIIDSVAVADPDKVCTKCNRAIINTFGNFIKENSEAGAVLNGFGVPLDLVKVGVAVKCGINFEDGKVGDPGK